MSNGFSNLKIQNKLIVSFVIIVIVCGVGIGWSIFNLNQMVYKLKELNVDVDREIGEINLYESVQYHILRQQMAKAHFLLNGDKHCLDEYWKAQFPNTKVYFGKEYENNVSFDFINEIREGVYLTKVKDDQSRFLTNYSIHQGGFYIGDLREDEYSTLISIN